MERIGVGYKTPVQYTDSRIRDRIRIQKSFLIGEKERGLRTGTLDETDRQTRRVKKNVVRKKDGDSIGSIHEKE